MESIIDSHEVILKVRDSFENLQVVYGAIFERRFLFMGKLASGSEMTKPLSVDF